MTQINYKIYLLVLFIISILVACEKEQTPVSKASEDKVPDQEMWNFDVRVTNKGRLNAHLKAGHMIHFTDNSLSLLNKDVMVDFYDVDGNHTSTLTSDSGLFNEQSSDVKAIKNVIVISDSGVTLYTQELSFDQQSEKIFTDKKVRITTTKGDTIHGIGFVSDTRLEAWEISKVSGTAHTGVDLSGEISKKSKTKTADSTKQLTKPDTLLQGTFGRK